MTEVSLDHVLEAAEESLFCGCSCNPYDVTEAIEDELVRNVGMNLVGDRLYTRGARMTFNPSYR